MKQITVIVLFLIVFVSQNILGQEKIIKVIDIKNLEYYTVYEVSELKNNALDTLIILSSKIDTADLKKLALDKERSYEIITRPISVIKVSENYIFCHPGVEIIHGIKISQKGYLPILILNAKEIP